MDLIWKYPVPLALEGLRTLLILKECVWSLGSNWFGKKRTKPFREMEHVTEQFEVFIWESFN
jgi:hypothetical protein